MQLTNQTSVIERLSFFDGQRLYASDLQSLEALNREMRWLHNQSLHQPGIGNGFDVIGKKGDREVKIMPGYAIDEQGREIVLTEAWVEQVPPVAGEEDGSAIVYDLTVSYPDDTQLEETEIREGVCLPAGAIRLREQSIFCWVRLNQDGLPADENLKQDVLAASKLILARAEVLNCRLNKDLSFSQRRRARPGKQPYIACGLAKPTSWQIWDFSDSSASATISDTPELLPFGLKARVETKAAGFVTTPCYSAHIRGPRIKSFEPGEPLTLTGAKGRAVIAANQKVDFIIDGLLAIVNPQPQSFDLEVLLLAKTLANGSVDISKSTDLFTDWYIVWHGVEG